MATFPYMLKSMIGNSKRSIDWHLSIVGFKRTYLKPTKVLR